MRITLNISGAAVAKSAAGAVLFVALMGGVTLSAATSAPGSADDPLVSKSYVDHRLASVTSGPANEQAIVDAVIARIEPLIAAKGGGGGQASVFVPVMASPGDVIIGGESTEIILRSGTAVVQLSGTDGLSDVTAGVNLSNNQSVTSNHLIIVPRADGRGMRVTSPEAWFMIKGGYNIQK